MRAGKLDRLIDIQRKTSVPSDSGEPVETWGNLASRRPASYRPLKGDERYGAPQTVATEQVEFRIRYSSNIANLTAQDRVIYPAMNEDSPEEDTISRRVFNILACHEVGRREGLQIITERRPDVL